MIRSIATLLTAAAIALTPVTPVQAQSSSQQDDLLRLLLGVGSVAAVAVAIDKARDRKDDRRKKEKRAKEKKRDHYDRYDRDRGIASGRRMLPAQCLGYVEGRRGQVRQVLGARCLERSVRHARTLPRDCRRQVNAFGRDRDVYGVRCLNKFGWTVARHR